MRSAGSTLAAAAPAWWLLVGLPGCCVYMAGDGCLLVRLHRMMHYIELACSLKTCEWWGGAD